MRVKARVHALNKGSRWFKSASLRQPVRDFRPLCRKVENTGQIGALSSCRGDRRSSYSAVTSQIMLDSLCREPSRCPFAEDDPIKAFGPNVRRLKGPGSPLE
jgi:hypothetical protein